MYDTCMFHCEKVSKGQNRKKSANELVDSLVYTFFTIMEVITDGDNIPIISDGKVMGITFPSY